MPKVACTSLIGDTGPHVELLKSAGFDLEMISPDLNLSDEATMVEALRDAEAVIAGSEPYTPSVLDSLPNLRAICRTGVGFDAINLPACNEKGIVVSTTPGVNHHAVAEHAIAMLMAVARGFPRLDVAVRNGHWARVPTPRVMGTTLGIVGLGRIGRATAWRGAGLGMKVIAFEPYPQKEFCEQMQIELVSRDELFSRSDYVSLHAPMTAENHHLINAQSIAKMKDDAVVINTARGSLIDESALYDALKSGRLRAAGLDVFEEEPLPLTSPLLELENILLAGHVAGLDNESYHDTFKMVAEIVIELHGGGWPDWAIQNLKGVSDWKW
ncbi:MAG: phosphoglycerate dehydrogenase [Planctomycetaceae bacterium]|jgi:D-3-phosphoglycerate dehydrogenase / 2-oxoglutarate reductase|nr:phosphoglycerate dehydrogenase [Planctomycetaceae bacterium]MBT6486041.1 phosphoglycerate dehydrogenase [Planctomycetaceae bacterium]MBT6495104.1 phosphoglycerate dehydrogenase [Planctomycetaceae bacterium]